MVGRVAGRPGGHARVDRLHPVSNRFAQKNLQHACTGGASRTCKNALLALRMAARLEKMACTSSGDIIVVECVIGDTNNCVANQTRELRSASQVRSLRVVPGERTSFTVCRIWT